MKGFFVLLLLSNVLFAAWRVWFAAETETTQPYAGVSLVNDGLILLSELDESRRPPLRDLMPTALDASQERNSPTVLVASEQIVEPVLPDKNLAQSTALCYQSSLLVTLNEAQALQQSLAEMGIKESERATLDTQKINYWVMLEPYTSRNKADEAGEILKKKQVKDFFIVRSGRYENAVSLGVYSTRDRADVRFKQIVALKAPLRKPVIEAIELPAKRLVVTFRLESVNNSEGFMALLDSSREPHLKKVSCN